MQEERYAVIDVGSNSTRLMLACKNAAGEVVPLEKTVIPCRLAQGLVRGGALQEEAMARTVAAVNRLCERAQQAQPAAVFAFATSALRDADNRDEFIRRVHRETSPLLEVLSGEEEARAGFAGPQAGGAHVVVDLGGGSTEVAMGCDTDIHAAVSMQMGAVRAMELYPLGDPVDEITLQAMQQWARHTLQGAGEGLKQALRGDLPVYGVGGTLTTLAAMDQRLAHYDAQRINGYRLTRMAVERLIGQMCELPLEKRRMLPGLSAARADIILGGAVIVREMMNYASLREIIASDSDNLEGYLTLELQNRA